MKFIRNFIIALVIVVVFGLAVGLFWDKFQQMGHQIVFIILCPFCISAMVGAILSGAIRSRLPVIVLVVGGCLVSLFTVQEPPPAEFFKSVGLVLGTILYSIGLIVGSFVGTLFGRDT